MFIRQPILQILGFRREGQLVDDEFLASLPEDSEEAFELLEAELRARANAETDPQYGGRDERAWRGYVIELHSFIQEHDLDVSFELGDYLPPVTDTFWARLGGLEQEIRIYISRARHRRAKARRGAPVAYVVLDSAEKRKLRQYIDKIREVVEASDISQNKKEAIFKRLNELQEEIDREKTKSETAFAAYLVAKRELGDAAGAVANWFDKIVTTLAKATPFIKAIKGPEEQKKLPAPEKKTPEAETIDEEIPF
jgi:hypothetical protein